jgi:hypothetical protein
LKKDYFKLLTGKDKKSVFGFSPIEDSINRIFKASKTEYDLRLLGKGDKEVWITEEERYVNFHILGSPGQGKSKFIEYNIRKDIDAGLGLCLLDPSDNGDTARNILAHCSKIGYEKVLWIDPITIYKYQKTPRIAPLNPQYVENSVEGVMEALSILFEADYSAMRRVRRYLSALLRIITKQNLTVRELEFFSDYYRNEAQRKAILKGDTDSSTIRNLFRSEYKFDTFFSSTVNLMDVLWQEPLATMLGHKQGIDFVQLVRDGYVILVNLSPSIYINPDKCRLLGVIIISQIIQAVDILTANKWKGVYYLYMDEAARFATPQIDTVLSFKRKTGLRLILAHHYFNQFSDKKVLDSIMNNARIKLMFDTPSYDDRLKMVKALGYGGDIPPLLAQYANQNIPKQYAIIRKDKETPVRIRIPDVEPCEPASEEYIKKILNQPFYADARSIPEDTEIPKPRKTSNRKTDSGSDVSRRGRESVPESIKKPKLPKDKKPIKI